MKDIVFLEVEDLLRIHAHQIKTYGGQDGIRDLGMLESACEMPRAGMGDVFFHTSLEEMAAAYLFHFCKNHPFVDGNKRIAAASAFHFLYLNRRILTATPDAYRDLVMSVAQGGADKRVIATFVKKHSKARG
jgi:death-on-curing protein